MVAPVIADPDNARAGVVPGQGRVSTAPLRLVLVVLMLVNVVNFIDRQLPFILIESIKKDLKLTDSEIGMLAGLTFALVFSLAALVLAWITDRWSARKMLVVTLALWSGLTALSGVARNFTSLLTTRVGVSASEAGGTPAAHALISRLFPVERRALALAFHSLGVPIGSMIGLVLGGWINDVANWRTAFFVVGVPGVALALIVWWIVPEIVSLQDLAASLEQDPEAARKESVWRLMRLRSFRHMAAACATFACGSYAINVFAAAFLIRVHGFTTAQAGLAFGLAFGLGGLAGTFLGGVLSDRLGRSDPRWRLLVPAIGQVLSFPTSLGAWLVSDARLSVLLLALSYLLGLLYYAPTFAAAQQLASEHRRATATALLSFCLNLVGSSVGPMVVGMVSDRLTPRYGHLSLRYALCLMGITILWSAFHFWRAAQAFPRDLERTRSSAA